jgi:hypothetical protein
LSVTSILCMTAVSDLAQAVIVVDQMPLEGLHDRIVLDGAATARVRGKAAQRRDLLA